MKTIFEPFRIKMVEPLRLTIPEQREEFLRRAHFNVFQLAADDVLIDLLTDSGTAAMGSRQWAGMMEGDESYAGARSWKRFEAVLRELTGMPHVLPTHQGRASERILFELVGGPGRIIPTVRKVPGPPLAPASKTPRHPHCARLKHTWPLNKAAVTITPEGSVRRP